MSIGTYGAENVSRRIAAAAALPLASASFPAFAPHAIGRVTAQTFGQGVLPGVLALTRPHPGAVVLIVILAASGIPHGHAYGEPIGAAQTTPRLAYLAGFATIQYALIVCGMLALERLARRSESLRSVPARIGSTAALLTGGLFLAMSLA